jgi:hypothetical protein
MIGNTISRRIGRTSCRAAVGLSLDALLSGDDKRRYVSFCEAVRAQEERHLDEAKKKLLRLRMKTVEPVFAVVKDLLGFRRYTVGGLDKVRSQWWFVCTLVNLLRIYPLWRAGELEFN